MVLKRERACGSSGNVYILGNEEAVGLQSNLPRGIISKKETYHSEPRQTKPHNPSVLYQGPKPFSRSLELISALVTLRTFHRINAIPNPVPFCTANARVIVPFLIIFSCSSIYTIVSD